MDGFWDDKLRLSEFDEAVNTGHTVHNTSAGTFRDQTHQERCGKSSRDYYEDRRTQNINYEKDRHEVNVSGTRKPETMAEASLRRLNSSNFAVDKRDSSTRANPSNTDKRRNEPDLYRSSPIRRDQASNSYRGRSSRERGRDQRNLSTRANSSNTDKRRNGSDIYRRSPFRRDQASDSYRGRTSRERERNQRNSSTHTNSSNTDKRRNESDLNRRSPFRRDKASDSYRGQTSRERNIRVNSMKSADERSRLPLGRRVRSPFTGKKSGVYPVKETRESNPFSNERRQYHGETRERSPFRSETNRLKNEIRERSYLTYERNELHRNPRRSPVTKEKSQSHLETRGSERSQLQFESSVTSPLLYQKHEMHRDTRGRSPFANERSRLHHETRPRNPLTSDRSIRSRSPLTYDRNQLHREARVRSSVTNERSPFTSETREPRAFNHEIMPFSQDNYAPYNSDFSEKNKGVGRYDSHHSYRGQISQDKPQYPGQNIAVASDERYINSYHSSEAEFKYTGNFDGDMATETVDDYDDDDDDDDDDADDDDDDGGDDDRSGINSCNPEAWELSNIDNMEEKSKPSLGESMHGARKTFIVPEEFPKQRFVKYEVKVLRSLIRSHLKKNNLGLKLQTTLYKKGVLVVTSQDMRTKQWLENIVPQLKGKDGRNLRVADHREIPANPTIKAIMTVSEEALATKKKSPFRLLRLLGLQNPGISTKHWVFLKSMRTPNDEICVAVKINHNDVAALKRFQLRPRINGAEARFNIMSH